VKAGQTAINTNVTALQYAHIVVGLKTTPCALDLEFPSCPADKMVADYVLNAYIPLRAVPAAKCDLDPWAPAGVIVDPHNGGRDAENEEAFKQRQRLAGQLWRFRHNRQTGL
jgi:hypothetical protein